MKRHLNVVGAVIEHDGRVLCAQRGSGPLAGMWEFPGGKVEANEPPRHALMREIVEELTCDVTVGDEVVTTTHEYEFAVIQLTTYRCVLTGGTPMASEHTELRWLRPAEMNSLDWAPADRPAVAALTSIIAS